MILILECTSMHEHAYFKHIQMLTNLQIRYYPFDMYFDAFLFLSSVEIFISISHSFPPLYQLCFSVSLFPLSTFFSAIISAFNPKTSACKHTQTYILHEKYVPAIIVLHTL